MSASSAQNTAVLHVGALSVKPGVGVFFDVAEKGQCQSRLWLCCRWSVLPTPTPHVHEHAYTERDGEEESEREIYNVSIAFFSFLRIRV